MTTSATTKHLLILGGAGRVGQTLIQQSLQRGYRVTALVRKPGNIDLEITDQLRLVEGDVTDLVLLQQLLEEGIDGVLSTLGIFIKVPGTPLADMTASLLPLLEQAGTRRLVCMSSLGVGDSSRWGNLLVKFITRITLRHVLVDKACQEKLIEHSDLDWTILRPPRILDSVASKPYLRWQQVNPSEKPRWQISKVDAAKEMLDLYEDSSSIGQTWHISY